jgi:heptaprenylglyceryl phosphate synthase
MIEMNRGVLAHLRLHRYHPMHVIDPFKVPVQEAVEKAVAVQGLGHPAILVASTDYERFEEHMPGYLAPLKVAVDIPLILHFPPRKGTGLPMVSGADAAMYPALLGSRDDYFVWKSYLETLATLPRRGIAPDQCPEPLLSAALTFGPDDISYGLLGTVPVDDEPSRLAFLADVIRLFRFDMVYLYSRFSAVAPRVCRFFRDHLFPEQLIFVSGGIRTREQIDLYYGAGADFVVFAGALEHPGWRSTLEQLCPAPAGQASGLVQ